MTENYATLKLNIDYNNNFIKYFQVMVPKIVL